MLRRLSAEDATDFTALRLAGAANAPDMFRFDAADDFAHDLTTTRDRLSRATVIGIYEDAVLVAIGGVEPFAGRKLSHKWLLWGMYAARAGAGHGGRIVAALVEAARAGGAQSVQLTLAADNERARALYERAGFIVYATEPQSFARGTGFADELLMRIVLAKDET